MFKLGNLNFMSTTCEWMASSGGKLHLKGSGTVNGKGSYNFILYAFDGQAVGRSDMLHIKIWNTSTNQVVYDNQPGADEFTDSGATISGGFILIQ